jgi:F0F1-type ATP synthase membrane subunit c/vacuolar-type H+-ATPase subunit K
MKLASRILLVLAIVLLASPAVFAQQSAADQEKHDKALVDAAKASNSASNAGVGMGLAIVGAGIGLGLIGYSALSGIARQPEQAGKIQGVMYVLAALVEGAAIIALLLCFLVAARLMG